MADRLRQRVADTPVLQDRISYGRVPAGDQVGAPQLLDSGNRDSPSSICEPLLTVAQQRTDVAARAPYGVRIKAASLRTGKSMRRRTQTLHENRYEDPITCHSVDHVACGV